MDIVMRRREEEGGICIVGVFELYLYKQKACMAFNVECGVFIPMTAGM
jgi:hypothetical protein